MAHKWIYLGAELLCALAAAAVLAVAVITRHPAHLVAVFTLAGCAMVYDWARRRAQAGAEAMTVPAIMLVFGLFALTVMLLTAAAGAGP